MFKAISNFDFSTVLKYKNTQFYPTLLVDVLMSFYNKLIFYLPFFDCVGPPPTGGGGIYPTFPGDRVGLENSILRFGLSVLSKSVAVGVTI